MIAGNCRMCLVEVHASVKLVVSCALPVVQVQTIFLNSLKVRKGKENVMEFLLLNHPLDCPVCDQGGECDLQDQNFIYGSDRGRLYEYRRAVLDKYFGAFVKTVMTRCIHCTRCIRFLVEVAGVSVVGLGGRGRTMEIGAYVNELCDTDLLGNLIDICPVGALTSKVNSFRFRSWEYKSSETIDLLDALGSNLLVHLRGNVVLRVLPRKHLGINGIWITDKARFGYDGLRYQRINVPSLVKEVTCFSIGWESALQKILYKICSYFVNIEFCIGKLVDVYCSFFIKKYMSKQNVVESWSFCSDNKNTVDLRSNFVFFFDTTKWNHIKFFFIVGMNLPVEFPLLLVRFRKKLRVSIQKFIIVGCDLGYRDTFLKLGSGLRYLLGLFEGSLEFVSGVYGVLKSVIILGLYSISLSFENIFLKIVGFLSKVQVFVEKVHYLLFRSVIGVMEVGILETGLVFGRFNSFFSEVGKKILFNCGVAEDATNMSLDLLKNFVIYVGMHWEQNALNASVVLPMYGPFEKEHLSVSLEGHVQKADWVVYTEDLKQKDVNFFRVCGEYLLGDVWSLCKKVKQSSTSAGLLLSYFNQKILNVTLHIKFLSKLFGVFYVTFGFFERYMMWGYNSLSILRFSRMLSMNKPKIKNYARN